MDILKEKNVELVFVLGHKSYYPKFGFIPNAEELGFNPPYSIPAKNADAWMVKALSTNALKYSPAKIRCANELNKPELWEE